MERILLDTHALLWWRSDDRRLSAGARSAIADHGTEALVSVATIWEIAIKRATGNLDAPESLIATVEEQGFTWLDIAPGHAWAVGDLPLHHSDPFDRLLVAQAIGEGIPLVTGDPAFAAYDVEIRW